jgi:hypothetical protein
MLFLFVASALVFTSCSNKLFESNWKAKALDAKFRFYDSESKIRYNIENDAENIYFSFDVMDQLTIQKILTTGIRLFIDGSGKKKERNELQFPIYSDKVPIEELNDPGDGYELTLDAFGTKPNQKIPTEGYLKIEGKVTSIYNGAEINGVLVSLRFDSTGSLVYMAQLPLNLLKPDNGMVSLGFETGGFVLPQTDQAMNNASVTNGQQSTTADRAMGRTNMNDPYGLNTPQGSSAAGVAMRNSTAYNKLAEPIRFWMDVRLATK